MSRTANSVRNGLYSVALFSVNIILNFVARGVFVRQLGADLLGLNSSVVEIIALLDLAELSIGTAVATTLYGFIASADRRSIAEVVALQGWVYRRVAIFILCASLAILPFFPQIFAGAAFPLWYAYAAYAVHLFASLLCYFVNYRMVVLDAHQQSYKVAMAVRIPSAIRTALQAVALLCFDHGYLWWLGLHALFAIVSSVALTATVRRNHPYLDVPVARGRELVRRYPQMVKMVGQLFFHRVSSVILKRTTPLVLLAYATLADVGIYGNYMLIFSGITMLVDNMLRGMIASVGNYVNSEGRGHELSLFGEVYVLHILVGAVFAFGFYVATPSFVTLWTGDGSMLLDPVSLALMSLMVFIVLSRDAVDIFISVHGFFSDIWAPVAEAGLNLGLSILLGHYFGLPGILAGVIVSLLAIVVLWKPLFLFRVKLGMGFGSFWVLALKSFAALAVVLVLALWAWRVVPRPESMVGELALAVGFTCLFGLVLLASLCLVTSSGRLLWTRIVRFVGRRWQ